MKKKILFFLAIFSTFTAFASNLPEIRGYVNDYAGIMKQSDIQECERYLKALDNQTGIQIVVLTVPDLQGENITSYSYKIAEKAGIGKKGNDNGALLLVAMQEHDVRIEVGYGLEGKLTDTKCGLIIRNVIIPEFKNGAYSTGIIKAVKNMTGIASDNMEIVDQTVQSNVQEDGAATGLIVMFIWLFFFFIAINSRSRSGIFRWLFWANVLGGNSHNNYRRPPTYTHNRSGSFGGGFSSGSSFKGGGGHFGGGGASGHW